MREQYAVLRNRRRFRVPVRLVALATVVLMTLDLPSGAVPVRATSGHLAADSAPLLAFTCSSAPFSPGEYGTSNVCTMTTDGKRKKTLTAGYSPAWSPDGMRLAFLTTSGPTNCGATGGSPWSACSTTISTMNVDGQNVHTGATLTGRFLVLDWSPDGKTFLLSGIGGLASADGAPTGPPMTVIGAGGGTSRVVIPDATGNGHGKARWSPDGKQIVYVHTTCGQSPCAAVSTIAVASALGAGASDRTSGSESQDCNQLHGDTDPTWDPDGKRIAYVHVGGPCESAPYAANLRIVGAGGGASSHLTDGDNAYYEPAWSPDGKRIATEWFYKHGPPWAGISIVPATGGQRTELTSGHETLPAWQPNPHKVWSVTFSGPPVVEDMHSPGGHKPGTPPKPRTIDQFVPKPCSDTPDTKYADWLDCEMPTPDGNPDKVWPVIAVRTRPLRILEVRFRSRKSTITPYVEAEVDLGNGTTLQIAPTKATMDGSEVVAKNLVTSAPLPDKVSVLNVTITWKVGTQAVRKPAGTSNHTVYEVFNTPLHPIAGVNTIYLSTLDLATTAARDRNSELDVEGAIFAQFQTLDNHTRSLTESDGQVTTDGGAPLAFWEGWDLYSVFTGLWAKHFPACPPRGEGFLLGTGYGPCHSWGDFLADALGTQGIATQVKSVSALSGFPKGPAPTLPGNCGFTNPFIPGRNTFMLIQPWLFAGNGGTSGDSNFPYTDVLRVGKSPDKTGVYAFNMVTTEFDHVAQHNAQGVIPAAGWFATGDHVVVVDKDGTLYDPSYGTGPFTSVNDWAHASIAGYAECGSTSNKTTTTYTLRASKGVPYLRPASRMHR